MVTHADELGIRKDQIFVGGESAGGGLCAALCMLARNRGEVNIAFQMPLYPMIDDRDTDSSRDNHNLVWNTSGWLKSPEGTAPEVRNAPNRGRRRKSAGVKESRKGMNKRLFGHPHSTVRPCLSWRISAHLVWRLDYVRWFMTTKMETGYAQASKVSQIIQRTANAIQQQLFSIVVVE